MPIPHEKIPMYCSVLQRPPGAAPGGGMLFVPTWPATTAGWALTTVPATATGAGWALTVSPARELYSLKCAREPSRSIGTRTVLEGPGKYTTVSLTHLPNNRDRTRTICGDTAILRPLRATAQQIRHRDRLKWLRKVRADAHYRSLCFKPRDATPDEKLTLFLTSSCVPLALLSSRASHRRERTPRVVCGVPANRSKWSHRQNRTSDGDVSHGPRRAQVKPCRARL